MDRKEINTKKTLIICLSLCTLSTLLLFIVFLISDGALNTALQLFILLFFMPILVVTIVIGAIWIGAGLFILRKSKEHENHPIKYHVEVILTHLLPACI